MSLLLLHVPLCSMPSLCDDLHGADALDRYVVNICFRFTITEGNKIDWLGWSLYMGYTPTHGPRFWDLRFKGSRMAYELSMQEAMAGAYAAAPGVKPPPISYR